MRVSVCINNYNYAEFVGDAVQSALDQHHPNLEVVVVDDGSVDGSRQVLEAFGDRIVLIAKPNGGQGSAMNAAFEIATGEVVMILDSDDRLRPDAASAVVRAFSEDPAVSMVQYRMGVIDRHGAACGPDRPPVPGKMPSGNLADYVLTHRCYHWQASSGLAFRLAALRPILPIPELDYRISADAYLGELAPFLGTIESLDDVLVDYRLHGSSNFTDKPVDAEWFRTRINQIIKGHAYLERLGPRLGIREVPTIEQAHDMAFFTFRLASLRLDRQGHPVNRDSRMNLMVRGTRASLGASLFSVTHRLRRVAWFISVGLSPQALARTLIVRFTPDAPKSSR